MAISETGESDTANRDTASILTPVRRERRWSMGTVGSQTELRKQVNSLLVASIFYLEIGLWRNREGPQPNCEINKRIIKILEQFLLVLTQMTGTTAPPGPTNTLSLLVVMHKFLVIFPHFDLIGVKGMHGTCMSMSIKFGFIWTIRVRGGTQPIKPEGQKTKISKHSKI